MKHCKCQVYVCTLPWCLSRFQGLSLPKTDTHTHLNFLHWNLSLTLMRASLWDQGRDLCRYISCLSCISLMSANSASVVVIFINWLLGEHSKILSIRNIGKNGRWRWWESKVRERTDFILRWRLNPLALESVTGQFHQHWLADLLLTMCQQIPATHHFSSFTCLLIVMIHLPKTHTNKYKTHHKAKALSVQWVYPRMISISSRAEIYSQLEVLSACQD